MISIQNNPSFEKLSADKGGDFGSASLPGVIATSNVITLESVSNSYKDDRQGFKPHQGIDFTASLKLPCGARDLLVAHLGKAGADLLISDWSGRVSFDNTVMVPKTNQAVLFVDSNNKARNRKYAESGAKTTQEEDFRAAGLEFADDLQATIICATLVGKAKHIGLDISKEASSWKEKQAAAVNQLSEAEFELLSKLRDGEVRSRSGALRVDVTGRLRASGFDGYSFSFCWAFGGGSPAELKN